METLQQQFSNQKSRRRMLMRRVWYTFALSLIVRPSFVAGFAFGASAIAFWRLVSITSIVENFLATEVGQIPHYIWGSLAQADTAALLAFMVLTIVSIRLCINVLTRVAHTSAHTWRPI